ncbi:SDR family oxidoreductase [Nocardioides sp.]|uniref:SDR family oxidoreductase n=1 Tax=Nocardioides sp. TaxID=35761 RepID=UPI00356717F5
MANDKYAQPDRRPAVVAGASSGIGAEVARVLVAAGTPVALGARRLERCEELAAELRAEGGEAWAGRLDITDSASVEAFAKGAEDALGEIEIVVANAGVTQPGRLLEVEPERIAQELDVNLVGVQRLVRAFVPGMVQRRRGDLVVVSSDVAVRARPFMSGYAASKWGLEGLTNALQMELEGSGVRVSIVRPGPTWSEMGGDWDPDQAADVLNGWIKFGLARHPHFLKPRAVAEAISTVVNAPRGVHLSLIEVNPEAPLEER